MRIYYTTNNVNVFVDAAKDCPFFHGPENKAEFKTDMVDVMRATRQRYRNRTKKSEACAPCGTSEDMH